MDEKTSQSPKDILTELETSYIDNMAEGQLADYLAKQAENEPI